MNSINSLGSNSLNILMPEFENNYQASNTDNKQSFQSILDITKNSMDNSISNSNDSIESNIENKIEKDNNYSDDNDYRKNIKEDENRLEDNTNNKKVNEKNDESNEVVVSQKDSKEIKDNDENKEKNLKEKLKTLRELIEKLENGDLAKESKLTLENIEEIKKSIISLKNELKLEDGDKKEIDSILAALSIISNNLENKINTEIKNGSINNVELNVKTRNTDNTNPKEEIKNIKEKLDKVIENIDSKVSENSNQIESSLGAIENNTDNIAQDKIESKSEKTKVQAEGRIDTVNNNSENDTTEITVVRMKDSVDDITSRTNNNTDNNIKANTKTDTIESAKNFQDMMSKLVDKAKVAVSEGKSEIVMTLKPERLGDVRLKLNIDGDGLNAKIFVDNAEIKDLFTKNIDTVIKSLSELNINIGGFDVMLRDDMSNDDMSEFKELLENGNNKSNFQKHNELDGNIKTIEKYTLPERRLNLVI